MTDFRGGRSPGPGRQDDSRAAVPWYVGTDHADAPPGHRYLLYLPFWKPADWRAIKEDKHKRLAELAAIPKHVGDATRALVARQVELAQAVDAKVISAVSTSPFATGLGWEHPNENGFAFLQPYGVPYLAGSGVKGVLRDAARELRWSEDAITMLFGPTPGSIKAPGGAMRGALRFFDVIPEIAGRSMGVEIMNPHYGDYYQGKSSPHDAGQPIPVFFLVVPPGSRFSFIVDCPRAHWLPEELCANWGDMIVAAFAHAFEWLGFGAKTAVGYGAMAERPAEPQSRTPGAQKPEVRQLASPPAAEEVWGTATLTFNPGTGRLLAAFKDRRTAPLERRRSDELMAELGERADRLKRDKVLKNVRVRVRQEGNMITLLGLEP